MKGRSALWWAWAFKNVGVMVCWTVLACVFGKWWIALFAALFTSQLTERETRAGKEDDENE